MALNTKSGRAFLGVVVIAVMLKIWLTADIRILPLYAPHDELNFVQHARHVVAGDWFGPYSDMTLIKGPSFQLFLALIDALGLPLPLAHQLLYAVACFVACVAVRPIVRGWRWLSFVYVVLLYNPFTDGASAWLALRSQINDSFALLAVACAAAVYIRRRGSAEASLPWLILLGITCAIFSFTREESIWLYFGVIPMSAATLWFAYRMRRPEFVRRAAYFLVPVAIWVLYWGGLAGINGHQYGWYTVVEMTSTEYVGAYGSLARIIPPHPDDSARRAAAVSGEFADVGVPRGGREIAYRVSPAARELEPALEGAPGKEWTRISCSTGFSCSDIPSGWFVWALRDAVAAAGHYHTGADARAFYVELSAQIDRACDAGTIRCRRKGHTLAPPIGAATIPGLLLNLVDAIRVSSTFSVLNPQAPVGQHFTPGGLEDYQLVTRDVEPEDSGVEYDGWIVDEGLQTLGVEAPGGVARPATVTFSISPDVYAAFGAAGHRVPDQAAIARFTITSSCAGVCVLVVHDRSGNLTRIPLTLSTPDYNSPAVHYHLDNLIVKSNVDADGAWKNAARVDIAHTYQAVMALAIIVAAALCTVRLIRLRSRPRFGSEQLVLAGGVCLSVGALIGILALITTISFPALNDDYMIGIPVLLLYGVAVVVAVEGKVAWRLLWWLVPARTPQRTAPRNVA